LTSGRVRALSLTALTTHPAEAGDAVAVTFDDGFLNVREAVEQLLDHGVPVTIFVVSGRVGETNDWQGRTYPGIPSLPLLGWKDLEHLVARGATVEAHTQSHPMLTRLSVDEIDGELRACRERLRERLGSECDHVAYPYGDLNDTVTTCASQHFRFGHTTRFRPIDARDVAMRLPRLDMYYFADPGAIEAWGTARFRRRLAWIRLRRRLRGRR
jgi:peptidoglycan/xylan/chitin deacetylase (PgdA/CDA1 family)